MYPGTTNMAALRQQDDVDLLFDVRNAFYIGNYQQCINEAQKIKPSTTDLQLERDVYLYRAYIAQKKYRVVLDEIHGASPAELRPLKLLADYFANPAKREAIVASLDEHLVGTVTNTNHTFVIVAATIYTHQEDYEAALKILHRDDHLESLAMVVQGLLRINRVDMARKELKAMQEKDEDTTLTQLAQAWVNITMGGDKLQEAYYIYQELIEKYSASATLLNGQAVALACQGKYEEAETMVQEAMERDPDSPDLLINTIVLAQHLGKPAEVASRYLTQLKESHKEHHFVKDYAAKEAEFDQLAKRYAVVAE